VFVNRGNPYLQPILGVAWDCGAVTTGPVTVPILIALGVSVMKAQRAKQEAFEAVEEAAVNTNKGELWGLSGQGFRGVRVQGFEGSGIEALL
jgi:phosphomannomutase